MSTGQDEPSPSLNGRLRPRKSASTPSLQAKIIRKEGRLAPDRPKRTSAPFKAPPAKQDDLVDKSDSAPAAAAPATLFLCPYCDRKFYSRQTASKHARRIHLSTSKQDNFIKCLYCNHSDANSNAIIKHMVDSHPNQYFTCMDCHTRFPSTAELAEHKHNVCEKHKTPYRSKLRQKTTTRVKTNPKKTINKDKIKSSNENIQFSENLSFNGIVISCELKPTDMHDAADIEDKITTNLILPSSKTLSNTSMEKNAVIVLDDFQWNKRIPPNFSFRNSDADQILSRLGVVHRSPRVGEARKDLIKVSEEQNEKFEKCFDTTFYSKVAKNVQDNLANFLDGTFNFNPYKDTTIKTRKSKASVTINTAEGFPILLASEQVSRHLCDGFIPRTMAPKHKWKWDSTENEKNLVMLLDQTKRDNHSNNCIISLISSLDIWTQLRMKSKYEEIVKTTPTAKKLEKQNIISLELKEILESRDIPSTSSQVVPFKTKSAEADTGSELTSYLGLVPSSGTHELQPAVLSGEWVRPRCYVCCACGDQTRDARTLSSHMATQHPYAQVEHYEIVGETLLSADILKHLYVPPSQISNRTRPPRGFRDCTKCKKSVTLEDLHQHMLDCAGDTPTVRRKCRYRPFGVRRRRPRLPDNTIRKKIRKDIRSRHRQKSHIRPRPRIRTEVGDAETIRKMIADLPAKRNRLTPANILRPRLLRPTVLKAKTQIKRSSDDINGKRRPVKSLNKSNKTDAVNKRTETDNSSTIDEDDQPLKLSATRASTRAENVKEGLRKRSTINKTKKKNQSRNQDTNMDKRLPNYYSGNPHQDDINHTPIDHNIYGHNSFGQPIQRRMSLNNVVRPMAYRFQEYPPYPPYCYPNQAAIELELQHRSNLEQMYRHNVNADLANRIHQSALERSHHRINMASAGPSNARQNSSRNNKNTQRRKDQSAERGNRSNKNRNIAQTPHLPFKHSIASLTSNADDLDASSSCCNPQESLENDTTIASKSTHSRTEFENEETVEKVDKPPISINTTQLVSANEESSVPSNSISKHGKSAFKPLQRAKSRDQSPSNELVDALTDNEQTSSLDSFKIPQKNFEQLAVIKEPNDLVELNPNHKIDQPASDSKIETDKFKCNRVKRGLNDCIAMLRTKKGLGFETNATKKVNEKAPGSDKVDLKPVDSKSTKTEGSNISTDKNTIISSNVTLISPSSSNIIVEENLDSVNLPADQSLLNDLNSTESVDSKEKFALDLSCNANKTEDDIDGENVHIIESKPLLCINKIIEEKSDGNVVSNLPLSDQNGATAETETSDQNGATAEPETQLASSELHNNNFDEQNIMPVDSQQELPNLGQRESQLRDQTFLNKDESEITTKNGAVRPTQPDQHSFDETVSSEGTNDDVKELTMFINMWRNSHGRLPNREEIECFLYRTKVNQTDKTTSDINIPNLTQAMITARAKLLMRTGGDIDINLLNEFSDRIVAEMQSRSAPDSNPTPEKLSSSTEKMGAVPKQIVVEANTSSRQSDLALRNTRQKTVKSKLNIEQQIEYNSEQTISPKQSLVSPKYHDLRGISINPIDSNRRLPNSYFPMVSPSQETLLLRTPPPPPPPPQHQLNSILTRRELSKRVLNTPETAAEKRDKMYLQKTAGISQDFTPVYYSPRFYNPHDSVYHKDGFKQIDPSIPNTSQSVHSYDEYKDLNNRYSSDSAFLSIPPDPRGNLGPYPKSLQDSENKSNIREATQENYQKRNENEHIMSTLKERSDNLKSSRSENLLEVVNIEDKYAPPENDNIKNKSMILEAQSHKRMNRRSSDTYYTHTSPYQSSVPNINPLDHPLSKNIEEHNKSFQNTLHSYQNSLTLSAVPALPTAAYLNNHLQVSPIAMPSPIQPLDLSWARDREQRSLELDLSLKTSSEVSKTTSKIARSNDKEVEKPDSPFTNSNISRNYSEHLPQRSLMPSRDDTIEEHTRQVQATLQKTDIKLTQETTLQKCTQTMYPPATSLENINATQISEPMNISLHNSSKHFNYNDGKINTGHQSGSSIFPFLSTPVNADDRPENENEKPILDHKTSLTQENSGTKAVDEKMKNKTLATSTNININRITDHTVSSNVSDQSSDDIDHTMTPEISTPNSNEIDISPEFILNIVSKEINSQISNHDTIPEQDKSQNDQDAETAQKIAMLPEELVKILGNIPKDHRNQLLKVLPQYISTPPSNVATNTNLTTCTDAVQNKNELRSEINKNIFTGSDTNLLSVKTAISPSSVIPKKRHSPLHSRERLMSTELLPTEPIVCPSFGSLLPQCSPIKQNECMEFKGSQREYLIKINESENKVLVPTINKAPEKNKDDNIIYNQSELAHTNKSNDLPALGEKAFFPTATTQDVAFKLPVKQKPFNEKTASLRAVRIKTTSAKKSYSEDNKRLTSYYTGNLNADHSGQSISSGHNIGNVYPTDLKYAQDKHLPNDTEMTLRDTTKLSVNCFEDKSRDEDITSNKREENEDYFVPNVTNYSEVPENKKNEFLNDDNTNTIHIQKSLVLEKNNLGLEPVPKKVTSQTAIEDKNVSDRVFDIKLKNNFENKLVKESLDACLTQLNTNSNDKTEDRITKSNASILKTNEGEISESFSDADSNKIQPLSTNCRDYPTGHNIALENVFINQMNSKNSLCKKDAKKEKETVSNEDESDDDVTLAVLKQKRNQDKETSNIDSPKTGKISSKLKNKSKRKELKVVSHCKKDKSMNLKNVEGSDRIVNFSSNDDIVLMTINNSRCDAVNDNQNLSILHPVAKIPDHVYESEVTENVNHINDPNDKVVRSKTVTENFVNIKKDKEVRNEDLVNSHLQPENSSMNCEKNLNMSEATLSRNLEIVKTSIDVSNSKTRQRSSYKSETKLCKNNSDSKKEVGLCSSKQNKNDDTETIKESVINAADVSNLPKPVDGIPSDIELCSEISDANTMPLRRSRRGKSMYVDMPYLEDSEQNEDCTKKTPLTMKRLILSRVEKDKKRISETRTLEINVDAADDCLSIDCEEEEGKVIEAKEKAQKRKKSPQSRRLTKKLKPTSAQEHDEDEEISDFNNTNNALENNICILRELPNAENKISDKDDLKNRPISDTTFCLSVITTKVSNEKETGVASDSLLDVKESSNNVAATVKRKVNSKSSEVDSSKSKKSKYQKKKTLSDFDSDDDKVLLETKQKMTIEKHLSKDHDDSSSLIKEDVGEKSKDINETNEESTLPSASIESRVTCYSKSISSKKTRSSSCNEYINYDPYDFDLIDMVETTGPITKKKVKNIGNSQTVKQNRNDKARASKKGLNNTPLKELEQTSPEIQPITNTESDSDSSKSDIPLQKYVDEKSSKDLKNKNNNVNEEVVDIIKEKDNFDDSSKYVDTKETIVTDNNLCDYDEKAFDSVKLTVSPSTSSKNKKHTKRYTSLDTHNVTDLTVEELSKSTNNDTQDDHIARKQSSKHKKNKRMPVARNVNSLNVLNEVEQQIQSDKFLENFGFYSERIPRKSNLLAAKKNSETFYMIGNENEDSLFGCKEKSSRKSISSESKKKSETEINTSAVQDGTKMTNDKTSNDIESVEPVIEMDSTKTFDRIEETCLDNSNRQPFTVEDNDIPFPFIVDSKEHGAQDCEGYQDTNIVNKETEDLNTPISSSTVQNDNLVLYIDHNKKSVKRKQNKQPGVKEKMYPDIEEIDMFEDKFDKIKRKRRSQAVAAKQIQVAAETNSSIKSRKQSEKKKSSKRSKKNYQSTVLTKGALKGFEGIKISIPTQDLNMPVNVSPPKKSKKRRKTTVKRKKEINDTDSSGSDFDEKVKSGMERDIYEFKDSEDAELFDLRPSTVMDRFRSMHNKHKFKPKDKEKKENEKEKFRVKVKERKCEIKESINLVKVIDHFKDNEQGQKKCVSRNENTYREYGSDFQGDSERATNHHEKNFEDLVDENNIKGNNANYDEKNEIDDAVASTSGLCSNRVDESDYESEMSSPEGDFIFYMSNDTNCVCPSDNDSDDSDAERGCSRLNCVNKNRNADKKAAIGNIFKNNAVRYEKAESKEPGKPRPNLDQLFDSLLETETKPYNPDMSRNQKDATPTLSVDITRNNLSLPSSLEMHHNLTEPKDGHSSSTLTDVISIFDENHYCENLQQHESTNNITKCKGNKIDKPIPKKSCEDNFSDYDTMGIYNIHKPKEDLGYSLMSEESTQVDYSDFNSHNSIAPSDTNDKHWTKVKGINMLVSNSNSEDEFDIDKPETLKKQYMHLILPAEKVSTYSQTDNDILEAKPKELFSAETSKMDYSIVPTKSTQSSKSKRHDNDSLRKDDFSRIKGYKELEKRAVHKNRARTQKYEVRDITHESKSKKTVCTEKNKGYRSFQYNVQADINEDFAKEEKHNRDDKKSDLGEANVKKDLDKIFQKDNDTTLPELVDKFTAPTSRRTVEKRSPRKSDEGISTGLDYSADQSDQSFKDAGVARQRARRKCTVGKQNVLAEHWSSESEFDGGPPRPNSAESLGVNPPRKKKSRKKEGHHTGGRKARHLSKSESRGLKGRERAPSSGRSEESDTGAGAGPARAPPGPKIRARAAAQYWSSESEDAAGPQPLHGWIVGDSHKKLVTMLAHAKGRKRNNADKHLD